MCTHCQRRLTTSISQLKDQDHDADRGCYPAIAVTIDTSQSQKSRFTLTSIAITGRAKYAIRTVQKDADGLLRHD